MLSQQFLNKEPLMKKIVAAWTKLFQDNLMSCSIVYPTTDYTTSFVIGWEQANLSLNF